MRVDAFVIRDKKFFDWISKGRVYFNSKIFVLTFQSKKNCYVIPTWNYLLSTKYFSVLDIIFKVFSKWIT